MRPKSKRVCLKTVSSNCQSKRRVGNAHFLRRPKFDVGLQLFPTNDAKFVPGIARRWKSEGGKTEHQPSRERREVTHTRHPDQSMAPKGNEGQSRSTKGPMRSVSVDNQIQAHCTIPHVFSGIMLSLTGGPRPMMTWFESGRARMLAAVIARIRPPSCPLIPLWGFPQQGDRRRFFNSAGH